MEALKEELRSREKDKIQGNVQSLQAIGLLTLPSSLEDIHGKLLLCLCALHVIVIFVFMQIYMNSLFISAKIFCPPKGTSKSVVGRKIHEKEEWGKEIYLLFFMVFFSGELFRIHVHIYACKLVSWIPEPDVQGSSQCLSKTTES